jgi:hypothetical protein
MSTMLAMPTFESSVVEYISEFGNLYYGAMNTDLFYRLLHTSTRQFLLNLKNIQSVETQQPEAFKLHLCRVALKESWRLPALISESSAGIYWSTGQGRLAATGLCMKEPHTKLKFLLVQEKDTDPNQFLQFPTLITTDQQLQEILNPLGNAEIELRLEQCGKNVKLTALYDGDQSHHCDAGIHHLDQLKQWQSAYGTYPTLHIYTNWPELIVDSVGTWDIKHQGSSPIVQTELFRLGHLEKHLYTQIAKPTHDKDHVLYITTPRRIDISDFLCWVDTVHSAYININGEFALFRPDTQYNTILMDVSYFK